MTSQANTATQGDLQAPLFAEASDKDWIDLGNGTRRRIRLHRSELMLVEVAFEARAVGAPHSHPHVQCSYIRSGSFDVTIAGTTRRLAAGGSFIVPPDAVHGVIAVEAGVLVDIFTPQREDFLVP